MSNKNRQKGQTKDVFVTEQDMPEPTTVNLPSLLDDRQLRTLENHVAMDRAVDDMLEHIEDGTPREQLDRCKSILRGTKAVDGFQERLSVMAGRVFVMIDEHELWKLEMKDGSPVPEGKKTDYEDAEDFISHNYPFSKQRIKDIKSKYMYRVKLVPAIKAAGLPLPKGETDIRHSYGAEQAVVTWAMKPEHKGTPLPVARHEDGTIEMVEVTGDTVEDLRKAERAGRFAAVEVYRLATEAHRRKAGDKAKSPTWDAKPAYTHLNEARMKLLADMGVITRTGSAAKAGKAVETTGSAIPDVKPLAVSVQIERYAKALKNAQAQMARLQDGHAADKDTPNATYDDFDLLLQEDLNSLVEVADNLAMEATAMANAASARKGMVLKNGIKFDPTTGRPAYPVDTKSESGKEATQASEQHAKA